MNVIDKPAFLSEDDILRDSEVMNQLEMLMHHPYSKREGIIRALYAYFLSPDPDNTAICMVKPEENAHESGLACSVLPKDRMDLSLSYLQCYIIIGNDSRKFLAYSEHFDNVVQLDLPLSAISKEGRRFPGGHIIIKA